VVEPAEVLSRSSASTSSTDRSTTWHRSIASHVSFAVMEQLHGATVEVDLDVLA
jgi:hypothetical protein